MTSAVANLVGSAGAAAPEMAAQVPSTAVANVQEARLPAATDGAVSDSLRAQEAQRPSLRDAYTLPRTGSSEALGDAVLQHLDRIQRHSLEPRTGSAGEHSALGGSTRVDGDAASDFDRHVKLLERSFNHAIEVELASKTSTSLASSMNKLMSGN